MNLSFVDVFNCAFVRKYRGRVVYFVLIVAERSCICAHANRPTSHTQPFPGLSFDTRTMYMYMSIRINTANSATCCGGHHRQIYSHVTTASNKMFVVVVGVISCCRFVCVCVFSFFLFVLAEKLFDTGGDGSQHAHIPRAPPALPIRTH